jgi:dTDP-glucose 4,6-dehydratase
MHNNNLEIKTIVITGGAGCIGSALAEHIIRKTNWNIIILDKLTYASNGLNRLRESGIIHNPRLKIFTFDLINEVSEGIIKEIGDVHIIAHLAAESHVDNSISNPVEFIDNNIKSTVNILEYARKLKKLEMFLQFSTDECFGSYDNNHPDGYTENQRHNPTNPYSASKSASEMICLAYHNTYKLPLIITNSHNVICEMQDPEKFVPKVMKYLLEDKTLQIHADKTCTIPGNRMYIHARNVSDAFLHIINNGKIGEIYFITAEKQMDNLELAQFISKEMGIELKYQLVNFHEDRPGHDLSYKLCGKKLEALGWKPPLTFEQSLKGVINWTMRNKHWLNL